MRSPRRYDQPGIAVLDRDGVYGSVRQHLAARKLGIRAHIGAEITCADGTIYPLLCETQQGYRNLCPSLPVSRCAPPKEKAPQPAKRSLSTADGLVCLARSRGRPSLETALLIFGKDNVYAELQRHMRREQEARNQHIIEVAGRMKIPLLATNGAWHAKPEQRIIVDVLTCVREKVALPDAGRLLTPNAERHLKTYQEMMRRFADVPHAVANTVELSDRLQYTMRDLGYKFPDYPTSSGQSMMSLLRELTQKGARERYQPYDEKARQQVERELNMIEKLGLAGYFLIVWDIVRFCQENNILAQGRGSAANSAVCYSLGITAVDPVGMELLFERFLSEERGEMPDIDIDLPSGVKREHVIQYVYERYGGHGAAMTANVITYRGRSAARDIGKVLGYEDNEALAARGTGPDIRMEGPDGDTRAKLPRSRLRIRDPRVRKFLELYVAVQDLPRHLGQHSGGMVICQGRLDSVVPLEPATMPGRTVVQWDKDDCADMGLLKIDLLGLGMMAVLEDTIELIDKHYDKRSISRTYQPTILPYTPRCKRRTPSASFRWKAARRWRSCPV